jgi:hypothetical protein
MELLRNIRFRISWTRSFGGNEEQGWRGWGLEFGSFDGKPTQVVFLLMRNRQEHSLHLKALARIARLIKSTAFIEKIVSSTSVQDMVRAFDEEEVKIC